MFEQMKGLSTPKKIEYYIHYYGLVTLVIVAVIAAVIATIVHLVTYKESVSGVLAVNADADVSGSISPGYFSDFLEEHGMDPDKNEIMVNSNVFVREDIDPTVRTVNEERIQTLFMTHCVDVFFSDEEYFTELAPSGFLVDLRDYLPEDVLEKYEDDLIYAESEETGGRIAAGIRVSADTPWMQGVNWYKESAVVGLSSDMKNEELAVDMLLCALGEDWKK